VSPACSANAGCAIRTGTRPAHLAGRRCACPAYNASVPQYRRPGKAQPPPGIRPGTQPEHLAGRRGACPAY
ncbi:hypothetical protein, partial [Klebsiella pneumoniae]|uniref:hypothetical protein n=1 Tax=Klebsiella pneumoniae TaxID=573 RepID=UPI001D0DB7F0